MSEPVVLIVDDVPDLLQIMAEAVRMTFHGYDVRTAANGAAATTALDRIVEADESLALVVTDQALGDTTGLELLRRARPTGAALVLVTGRASPEIEAEAQDLGVHLLWKPFRLKGLLALLSEAVPTQQ